MNERKPSCHILSLSRIGLETCPDTWEDSIFCYQVREQRQNPVNAVFGTGIWYIWSDFQNAPPPLIRVAHAPNNTKDIHSQVNTLRAGDADLRLYITTVQDG